MRSSRRGLTNVSVSHCLACGLRSASIIEPPRCERCEPRLRSDRGYRRNLMFAHLRSFAVLLILLLASGVATAATFNVTVGGTANAFAPSTLNIHVGDTVTWTNAGGFHNVAAADSSFRNGNPSSST